MRQCTELELLPPGNNKASIVVPYTHTLALSLESLHHPSASHQSNLDYGGDCYSIPGTEMIPFSTRSRHVSLASQLVASPSQPA